MLKEATISKCGNYRYNLTRKWNLDSDNLVLFIALNPSTADDKEDDQTLTKCISIGKNLGFDGLILVNLFAYRATSPEDMKSYHDPVGENNNEYIVDAIKKTKKIIVCWGNEGTHKLRNEEVISLLTPYQECVFCFRRTVKGQPWHPLYLPKDSHVEKFFN